MKIAFFTEGVSGIRFPRNFFNMRTDVAWQVALNSDNYNHNSRLTDNYDIGIIIISKQYPKEGIDCFYVNRDRCKKWTVMQEGPQELWQDWPNLADQICYLNLLTELDFILCHNEIDVKYYRGLTGKDNVFVMPSLMIEDSIPKDLTREENRSDIMIGGNWTSWYSGQDSLIVAQHIAEDTDNKIYAVSMGRKHKSENLINSINYIKYMGWQLWMQELSKRKYAIHLMRTYAAGTFALNCAYLGIPCIGYKSLDTQRNCFPELSVQEGDLDQAIKTAKHLKENEMFYRHVCEYAKKAYADNFSEKKFIAKMNDVFNEVFKK